MENSRTGNVIRNVSWATLLQVLLMILQFVARTFFIQRLGKDYLGITGLFSDIVWILELANMRIPDAIILSMYKPLSEKDYAKVRAIIHFFRKACFIISFAIMVIGLFFIPLLPYIIKDPPHIPENFTIMYLFYLFEKVFIYLFIYKKSIIFADQKDYIVNIYLKASHFLQIILQIIILLTIRNFYLFLLAEIFTTVVMTFMINYKANKLYPFIIKKNTEKLKKEEVSEIFVNVKSMFLYGLGSATLIGIDSILVSSIVGIGVLGLCTNYLLIINSVKALIDQAMTGFTASIGNLNVEKDIVKTEETFNQVNFIVFMVAGFCAVNMGASLDYLIDVWLGESFLISRAITISLVLRFYIQATQYTTFTFRSTLGLMKKWKMIPIVTAVVNIASSIVMGKYFSAAGIFFASSIAIFFCTIIPEAILLYKFIFTKSSRIFFLRYIGYLFFLSANYLITCIILDKINFSGWAGFFGRATTGAVISGILFIIIFFRDKNFIDLVDRIVYMIKDRKNREE